MKITKCFAHRIYMWLSAEILDRVANYPAKGNQYVTFERVGPDDYDSVEMSFMVNDRSERFVAFHLRESDERRGAIGEALLGDHSNVEKPNDLRVALLIAEGVHPLEIGAWVEQTAEHLVNYLLRATVPPKSWVLGQPPELSLVVDNTKE